MVPTIFLPRGIRNNNPGNIRLSAIRWQGQKLSEQHDEAFVEFSSPLFGLRALMKLLLTYHLKHGLDTIEAIVNRFAPPCENTTDSYIYAVAKFLNVRRREQLNLRDKKTLIALTKAIVQHENGKPLKDMPAEWYEQDFYQQAADLILSHNT